MKQTILNNLKVIVLALILGVGASYVSAAWTNPPANPPERNTDAPINVGVAAQVKAGAFGAPTLEAVRELIASSTNLKIAKGVEAGKVLVASGQADGLATWQDAGSSTESEGLGENIIYRKYVPGVELKTVGRTIIIDNVPSGVWIVSADGRYQPQRSSYGMYLHATLNGNYQYPDGLFFQTDDERAPSNATPANFSWQVTVPATGTYANKMQFQFFAPTFTDPALTPASLIQENLVIMAFRVSMN